MTSIGYNAFKNCSGLISVTIPNSVTSIDGGAFYQCSGLTSVNYIGTIAQWCGINFSAYSSCPTNYSHSLSINGSLLTNLVIPDGVTEIKQYAFYNCSDFTSVAIPNSVISIGSNAFYNVRHIEYYGSASGNPWGAISINGVTEGDFVYSDSTKHYLVAYSGMGGSVTVPLSVDTIGNKAFYGCSGLISVTILDTVAIIGNYSFYECSGLTSVTLGRSLSSIGNYAFNKCTSLTSVTIPESVTNIGYNAFYGCSNLTELWLKPTTPPTLGNASSLGADSVPLIVPHNSYNAYTSAGTNYTNHPIYRDSIIVTALVNDTIMGYVTGGDTILVYPYDNDTVTLTATAIANYGYHFVRWDDNSTDNPLQVVVTDSNITRTAIFPDFDKHFL